ncbi:MAG TPA: nitrogen regulation protein NR(I) [Gammaproteobacteria bacterium]|nr:nitrogen regulation protein NR(I) [Gammaproteobacteria bacterium]
MMIWIVDDDKSIRWVLERALQAANYTTRSFADAQSCRQALETGAPNAMLVDIRLGQESDSDGFILLQQVHDTHPQTPVILMTAHSDLDTTVAAYDAGAFEYLPKPFDLDDAVALVERATGQTTNSESPASPQPLAPSPQPPSLLGQSPALQTVFRAIGRLAQTHVNVLITGATGTGKELVARALHDNSARATKPFIALNTAAIPSELLESELFGHERGAFTGATSQRQGRFEQAAGGTLFLDEIGDMPAALQTRLLRVLAEGEFYRVGGHAPIKTDVRVLAATHQDLQQRVQQGRFREDLYHRLNVVHIHVPALVERREDIPQLARHFMQHVATELGVDAKTLADDAIKSLQQRTWPGNVRELRNLCRRVTVMAAGNIVHARDLPASTNQTTANNNSDEWETALQTWAQNALQTGQPDIANQAIARAEKLLLDTALAHTHGHKQKAAKRLGWGRNTLTRKLQAMGKEKV